MKGFIVGLALALMLVPVAQAGMPLTVAGIGAGYGANASSQGEFFTNYWAGLKTVTVSEYTGIYGCYQNIGRDGGEKGNGVSAVLISGSEKRSWFSLLADIGVAFDLAQDADGSHTAAFTAGGGMAIKATEYIAPYVYAKAYDSGPNFSWAVYAGMGIVEIEKLIKLR